MAGIRVLVVDDDQDLREVTVELLQSIGCDVSEATNGHAAMDFIRRNDTDVVIIDLQMPLMDGMRLVENLSKEGFPTSKIMVYSGALDAPKLKRLAKLQVKHFFVKPVAPKPFLERIQEVAEQNRPLFYNV